MQSDLALGREEDASSAVAVYKVEGLLPLLGVAQVACCT